MNTKFDKDRPGTGTREWSESSYNIGTGCSHGCIYCFARQTALRFKKIESSSDWINERVHPEKVTRTFGKRRGVIMFPTQHDITPGKYLSASLIALKNMLEAGNQVLVVSKPHFECIEAICDAFDHYRNQIMFRFTIGNTEDSSLGLWEPGAPKFEERLQCLELAFRRGFKTSVSVEPLLGSMHVAIEVFNAVQGLVTDTVWIGKMNKPLERCLWNKDPDVVKDLNWIISVQNDEGMMDLYRHLKSEPKVRWKDSIKEVVKRMER